MSTIAAIITAPSKAAVSIIKISGEDSFRIVEKLTNKTFTARMMQLAWICDPSSNAHIDQALVLPFRAPHSYTGEDVIEIHLHGGVWLTEKVLSLVLEQGAVLAKAGEFTERAFLNHKIDLSQAEAIMDLIEARTNTAGNNAIKLYEGYLGKEIFIIRERLLNLLGALTAAIDFPDEVGDYNPAKFRQITNEVIAQIDQLLAGEQDGHILRNGYKVAIIGNPNVGKSTLLNTLLRKERAIVTEIAGTTRDLIEESYSLNGMPIILLDTAGLRESDDRVEKIGIQRTLEVIEQADLILHLQDLSKTEQTNFKHHGKEVIRIGTKADLNSELKLDCDIQISAVKNHNIDTLKEMIFRKITDSSIINSTVKINHRQADILRKTQNALLSSLEASSETIDFWTIDLRQAIIYLGEITGETLSEELLDNIFGRFCIGK